MPQSELLVFPSQSPLCQLAKSVNKISFHPVKQAVNLTSRLTPHSPSFPTVSLAQSPTVSSFITLLRYCPSSVSLMKSLIHALIIACLNSCDLLLLGLPFSRLGSVIAEIIRPHNAALRTSPVALTSLLCLAQTSVLTFKGSRMSNSADLDESMAWFHIR